MLISGFSAIGQSLMNTATVSDNAFSFSSSTYGLNHESAIIADGSGGHVYATVWDGNNAGIEVSNGTQTGILYFSSLSLTGVSAFYKPDVVLLQQGAKAIVTFETDNATYNAHVVELDITPSGPTTYTITVGVLAGPIDLFATTYEPHIDSDPYSDRFVIVYTQIISSNSEIFFDQYENVSSAYTPTSSNVQAASATPGTTYQAHPDIALSFDEGANFRMVVTYVEYDGSDNWLNVEEFTGATCTTPYVFHEILTASAMDGVYPRIGGENSDQGLAGSDMQWAVVLSQEAFLYQHLWYINSYYQGGTNPSAWMVLDAQSPASRNFLPAVDWMNTGNNDGFAAWRCDHNNSFSTGNCEDIMGVMEPFYNSNPTDWYDVNTTSTSCEEFTNTSVCSDYLAGGSPGEYIVSWSQGNMIYYKILGTGSTSFKQGAINTARNLNVYPNPASSFLQVNNNSSGRIQIKNVFGSTMFESNHAATNQTVDISNLPKGVYVLSNTIDRITFTKQ